MCSPKGLRRPHGSRDAAAADPYRFAQGKAPDAAHGCLHAALHRRRPAANRRLGGAAALLPRRHQQHAAPRVRKPGAPARTHALPTCCIRMGGWVGQRGCLCLSKHPCPAQEHPKTRSHAETTMPTPPRPAGPPQHASNTHSAPRTPYHAAAVAHAPTACTPPATTRRSRSTTRCWRCGRLGPWPLWQTWTSTSSHTSR